ncbi:unnamed protein product, partial [Rhizoctonia solani]
QYIPVDGSSSDVLSSFLRQIFVLSVVVDSSAILLFSPLGCQSWSHSYPQKATKPAPFFIEWKIHPSARSVYIPIMALADANTNLGRLSGDKAASLLISSAFTDRFYSIKDNFELDNGLVSSGPRGGGGFGHTNGGFRHGTGFGGGLLGDCAVKVAEDNSAILHR